MSKVVIRNERAAGAVEEEERPPNASREKRSGSLEHMWRGWWRGVLESTSLQLKMHWRRTGSCWWVRMRMMEGVTFVVGRLVRGMSRLWVGAG